MPGPGRLPASEFSAILKNHFAPIFRILDVDRYYLGLWSGLQLVAEILHKAVKSAEKNAIAVDGGHRRAAILRRPLAGAARGHLDRRLPIPECPLC